MKINQEFASELNKMISSQKKTYGFKSNNGAN
jgi:predicted secreted protein